MSRARRWIGTRKEREDSGCRRRPWDAQRRRNEDSWDSLVHSSEGGTESSELESSCWQKHEVENRSVTPSAAIFEYPHWPPCTIELDKSWWFVGLAAWCSVGDSILPWASGRGDVSLQLASVLAPFPQNSLGWEYTPRSNLCTLAFHRTDSNDPDIHVLDGWMPATKRHAACTIHEGGMWLPLWLD